MSQVAHVINENTITCVIDGRVHTIQRDHPESGQVLRAIKEDWVPEAVVQLFDKIKAMASYMAGSVEIRGNSVYANGEPIHNVIAERILKFMGSGLPHEPLVKFLEHLKANPSYRSLEQLYTFLENKNLPITPDGKFLAYKAIRADWTDKWTGSITNSIGSIVTMARNKVDDNPGTHCSYGLHVGSIEYVSGYRSADDLIVIVEVDPADVVSVPQDGSCEKVRVCKYKVTAEYVGDLPETLVQDASHPYDDDRYEEDDISTAHADAYQDGYHDALAQMRATVDDLGE